MKRLIILFLTVCCTLYNAQQVHVKYLKVLSSFSTTHEDLYIKNKQVLSVQDSIVTQNKLTDSWTMVVNLDNGKKIPKQYFVSDLSTDTSKDFFFTAIVENNDFFVYDKVPQINWIIDENSTKTVAGYKCTKATGTFRGSKITAYFAKQLPYSAGPFKFYGLPGLILDIRADGMDHEIWKAESVNIDDKTKIAFKPQFLHKEKISFKDYVDAKESHMNKMFKKVSDALPASSSINVVTNQRFTVEQKYEWE